MRCRLIVLAIQIWMCGGGILFVPCSHVGHVYRMRMPYGMGRFAGKPVIATVGNVDSAFCAFSYRRLQVDG